jgi:hypothetical protein
VILFYDLERSRKIGYIRVLKVVAFFWICFVYTYYWAFNTYPINFNDYPEIMTRPISVLLLSGIIFGFDMLLFYVAFQTMYEKLKLVYLRKVHFNPLFYVVKTYMGYAIPISFLIACMTSLYPFLGDGPIFPHFTSSNFI